MSEAFDTAMAILRSIRLSSADEESRWHDQVANHAHVWGDFYGPASSPHLARAIAHRFMDRQGGDLGHLKHALAAYGCGRCAACDHTHADHVDPPRSERCSPIACMRGTGNGSVCPCEAYEAPPP